MKVGVVGDTHGLLRPEVLDLFIGVRAILHTGDVDRRAILDELEAVAPVTAVWGNMDGPGLRDRLEESVETELADLRIALIHGHQIRLHDELVERFPGAAVVVHGHTHLPRARRLGDVLVLNPGSAGPRRAGKPVCAALLEVEEGEARVRHYDLLTGEPFRP